MVRMKTTTRMAIAALGLFGLAVVSADFAAAQRATETEGSCRRIPQQYGRENVWFGKIVAQDNTFRDGNSFKVSNRVRCFTTVSACNRWLTQRASRSRYVEFGGCDEGGPPRQSVFKRQLRGYF